jgi:imidazolonepropionase-like amidohydrolase
MTRTLVAAFVAFFSLSGFSADLLVRNATLWTDNGPQPRRDLLIVEGRVVKSARAGSIDAPAGARVIDANGDTLLPGLIDAHVHLVSGFRLPEKFGGLDRARVAAKQLLRSGVTSGRVHLWGLASAMQFEAETRDVNSPAPRLVYGGPGLFGGQPDWYADDGNGWGVRDAADAEAKLQRLHAAGIRWVTLHDLGRFQPGEAETIVRVAHRLGMRVGAQGDRLEAVERALALGVDSIEYLDRGEAIAYPKPIVDAMRARGDSIFLVPAIGFPHRYAAYRQHHLNLDDPRLTEFMPEAVAAFARATLRDDQDQPIRYAPEWTSVPPATPQKFRQLASAGLPLTTGTDCGSPVHSQADAIWWELETWRQLGVPLADILRGATRRGARLIGDEAAGHLGVGAHGDIVLYRGSLESGPLSVERVRVVAKAGVLFVDEGNWVTPSGGET